MNRRNFVKLGLGAVAVAGLVPSSLLAVDFRKEKPEAWKAKTPNDAIKALFGSDKMEKSGVNLKAPEIAENGAVIPITIKEVPAGAKTVAVFQDANPESAVAVFTIHPRSVPNGYSIRIRMKKTGKVIVVADVDGKLFYDEKTVKVTKGGCGGWCQHNKCLGNSK